MYYDPARCNRQVDWSRPASLGTFNTEGLTARDQLVPGFLFDPRIEQRDGLFAVLPPGIAPNFKLGPIIQTSHPPRANLKDFTLAGVPIDIDMIMVPKRKVLHLLLLLLQF